MKRLLLLTTLFILTSCSTLDERVQRIQDKKCSVTSILTGCTTLEERVVRYKEKCSVMGFSQNTPEMATCVLQLENQRQANASANARAVVFGPKSILEDDNTVDNQIINHGAGGCTPNVATGGCLD